ncbi:hypothetical protein EDB83DRAFT_2368708 [Lactarius deliciosus]|nr:hypothetical protein EDB83DRAFT_2368708 [Lactarius deliciosus]
MRKASKLKRRNERYERIGLEKPTVGTVLSWEFRFKFLNQMDRETKKTIPTRKVVTVLRRVSPTMLRRDGFKSCRGLSISCLPLIVWILYIKSSSGGARHRRRFVRVVRGRGKRGDCCTVRDHFGKYRGYDLDRIDVNRLCDDDPSRDSREVRTEGLLTAVFRASFFQSPSSLRALALVLLFALKKHVRRNVSAISERGAQVPV